MLSYDLSIFVSMILGGILSNLLSFVMAIHCVGNLLQSQGKTKATMKRTLLIIARILDPESCGLYSLSFIVPSSLLSFIELKNFKLIHNEGIIDNVLWLQP